MLKSEFVDIVYFHRSNSFYATYHCYLGGELADYYQFDQLADAMRELRRLEKMDKRPAVMSVNPYDRFISSKAIWHRSRA